MKSIFVPTLLGAYNDCLGVSHLAAPRHVGNFAQAPASPGTTGALA